jgi:predicted nucleic acid-binding Zn ribbon protein
MPEAIPPKRLCKWCGKILPIQTRGRHEQQYCNKRCKWKGWSKEHPRVGVKKEAVK